MERIFYNSKFRIKFLNIYRTMRMIKNNGMRFFYFFYYVNIVFNAWYQDYI